MKHPKHNYFVLDLSCEDCIAELKNICLGASIGAPRLEIWFFEDEQREGIYHIMKFGKVYKDEKQKPKSR